MFQRTFRVLDIRFAHPQLEGWEAPGSIPRRRCEFINARKTQEDGAVKLGIGAIMLFIIHISGVSGGCIAGYIDGGCPAR